MSFSSVQDLDQALDRVGLVRRLRALLPAMEGPASGQVPALSIQVPEIDSHFPSGGLAVGALHEIAPVETKDAPAALGFAASLLATFLHRHCGLALLVVSTGRSADCGRPYAHGLHGLGLDPGRLIVIEAWSDEAALWAIEEALRSRGPAAVLAMTAGGLDLTASRRLHLAAGSSGSFLAVLRPAHVEPAAAAVTRWRIASAPAGRDRFGSFGRCRWRVTLERCRNGRPGAWIMEWDHATHRFNLAGTLAHHAVPASAEQLSFASARRAG
jgi:protein ImuA